MRSRRRMLIGPVHFNISVPDESEVRVDLGHVGELLQICQSLHVYHTMDTHVLLYRGFHEATETQQNMGLDMVRRNQGKGIER